jgi:hypothetical protein
VKDPRWVGRPPLIEYDADATQLVEGTWIASVRLPDGSRLGTRRGAGAYTDRVDDPKIWSWLAFFDDEKGTLPPMVPTEPFVVCVRYIATTRDAGITDDTPSFCSPVYYPTDQGE